MQAHSHQDNQPTATVRLDTPIEQYTVWADVQFNIWGELLLVTPVYYSIPNSPVEERTIDPEIIEAWVDIWKERLQFLLPVLCIPEVQALEWPDDLSETRKVIGKFPARPPYTGDQEWIVDILDAKNLNNGTQGEALLLHFLSVIINALANPNQPTDYLQRLPPALLRPFISLIGNVTSVYFLGIGIDEKTLKLVSRKFRCPIPRVKKQAFEVIGNSYHICVFDLLNAHLKEHPEDAALVFSAFGALYDKRASGILLDAFPSADDTLKEIICESLRLTDDPFSCNQLIRYYDQCSKPLKKRIINSVHLKNDRVLALRLLDLLNREDLDREIEIMIIDKLRTSESNSSLSLLLEKLEKYKKVSIPNRSDDDLAAAILYTLCDVYPHGTSDILCQLLPTANKTIKTTIQNIFYLLPDNERGLFLYKTYLDELKENQDDSGIMNCMERIANINSDGARELLSDLTYYKSDEIAIKAIRLLGQLNYNKGAPQLLKHIRNPARYEAVLDSLVRLNAKETVDYLINATKQTFTPEFKAQVWITIALLGDDSAIRPLCTYIKMPLNVQIRCRIARALGILRQRIDIHRKNPIIRQLQRWKLITSTDVCQTLKYCLDQAESPVKKEIFIALARLNDTTSINLLVQYLDSTDNLLAEGAAKGLVLFRDSATIQTIAGQMTNVWPKVREEAYRALADWGGEAGIIALRQRLDETSGSYQRELVKNLKYTRDITIVPHLINLLQDPIATVRAEVVKTLWYFDLPAAHDAILSMQDDPHPWVREAVLTDPHIKATQQRFFADSSQWIDDGEFEGVINNDLLSISSAIKARTKK